jgi:hypothetical protein
MRVYYQIRPDGDMCNIRQQQYFIFPVVRNNDDSTIVYLSCMNCMKFARHYFDGQHKNGHFNILLALRRNLTSFSFSKALYRLSISLLMVGLYLHNI